jgi:hypothetical protein
MRGRMGQWSGLIYARRSISTPSGNVTVLMHRVVITERMGIARPSERHFVDHKNGDPLDNRRCNLRWLTAKENMAARHSQRGVHALPLPPESGLTEIPF